MEDCYKKIDVDEINDVFPNGSNHYYNLVLWAFFKRKEALGTSLLLHLQI